MDMYGYPVEMYVRDGRAYVVLTNFFRMWINGDGEQEPNIGSSVTVVDVSDSSSPSLLSRFVLAGYVTDTRIVGDVLYAVANRYSWFWYYDNQDNRDLTTVMSINVADPLAIHKVDEFAFDKCDGWDNHVHVTKNAIYIASSCWDANGTGTQIRYVDISDPQGHMALGAQFQVPGYVMDRWAMSEYQGVFRVITSDSQWGSSQPHLFTYQVDSPTQIVPLASLSMQLPQNESLRAARFDGNRGYLVTYEQIDPLFTVDLSDPTHPVQAGALEMPGWLDHIVPRGDRLVALGHDDSDGTTRLSVSLFDVSDLTQPTLLARVNFGEGWGWLTDERDNFEKVFKVLDDLHMILVPFMEWVNDPNGWGRYEGGVQIIDFTNNALTLRGKAGHDGYIRRALMLGGRLVTMSDQRLQVLDITDRDHPMLTGDVALSRNVTQLVNIGQYSVQLVGDWWSGKTSVVVMPLANPDLGEPVAELRFPAPYARFFSNDGYLFVVYRDTDTSRVMLRSVDLTDPTQPRLAGVLDLPDEFDTYGYYYGWWWWGYCYPMGYDSVVQVDGSKLVFHSARWWWYYDDQSGRQPDQLFVVDLSTPAQPRIASTIALDGMEWVSGMMARGSTLVFTHYRTISVPWDEQRQYVRYYMDRLDLTDPDAPVLAGSVNVPGFVLDFDPSRNVIITEDFQWLSDGSWQKTLNSLWLRGPVAVLASRITLPEYASVPLIDGARAAFVTNQYWYDEVAGQDHYASTIQTVDLSDPNDLQLAGETDLAYPWASLFLLSGNRLVVGTWSYVAGLFVYDVSNLSHPVYLNQLRTDGWVSDLLLDGGLLYVATGPYGVRTLNVQGR